MRPGPGAHSQQRAAASSAHHHLCRRVASASAWRRRLSPDPKREAAPGSPRKRTHYRTWADLLARTFALDSLECPRCQGRMRLIAMITRKASIERYLTALGDLTEVPRRSPGRAPPYWKSRVLRRLAAGDLSDDIRDEQQRGAVNV